MVGVTNRSMAAMSDAWLRRKVDQPRDGGPHRLTMYFATLDCETSKPSLSSSPWTRGAPHSGQRRVSGRVQLNNTAATQLNVVMLSLAAINDFLHAVLGPADGSV